MKESISQEQINRYEMATFAVERHINAMLKGLMPEELTIEQYNIIRFIRMSGRSTSSELADSFCVGKSSITAIVTRLVEKGYIQRILGEKDRRVVYLSLTEEGEQICMQLEKVIQNWLAGVLTHFPNKEAELFIIQYEKLAQVLADRNASKFSLFIQKMQ